jgi:hypothetical protein
VSFQQRAAVAQTFTQTSDGTVGKVRLKLQCGVMAIAQIRVSIVSVGADGAPNLNNNASATWSNAMFDVPDASDTGDDWVEFQVSELASYYSAGGRVAIVVESDNESCALRSGGSGYAGGSAYFKASGAPDWKPLAEDILFQAFKSE